LELTIDLSNQMIITPQKKPTKAAKYGFSNAVFMAKLADKKANTPVMKTMTPSMVCVILVDLEQSGEAITSGSVFERY
jgi:hypothetical protein